MLRSSMFYKNIIRASIVIHIKGSSNNNNLLGIIPQVMFGEDRMYAEVVFPINHRSKDNGPRNIAQNI
ncbi:hypothetical protein H5410_049525 [Solanum commersonii]|uniref:Uncharacterized protein n=1 Tax=Solanum commersonii TaxID=4109 RepID=A0A9J5WT56_SOLCO|nr:hypothetical protein H5410_049525 [Solanum commersonii]